MRKSRKITNSLPHCHRSLKCGEFEASNIDLTQSDGPWIIQTRCRNGEAGYHKQAEVLCVCQCSRGLQEGEPRWSSHHLQEPGNQARDLLGRGPLQGSG